MAIDIGFALVALFGMWYGYSRGIIQTVATVLSLFLGLMAAAKFGRTVTELLQDLFNQHTPFMFIVGVIATFLITVVIFRMAGRMLESALESFQINAINRAIGGLVLALVFIFLYSVLLSFADRSRMIEDETKAESATYAYLEVFPEYASGIGKKVWPVFQEFYDYALDIMDEMKDGGSDSAIQRKESQDIFDLDEN